MAGTTWTKEVITLSAVEAETSVAGTLSVTGLATFTNGLKLGNNTIYASDGGASVTVDNSDNMSIGGSLTVGGNIIKASDGGSTITMDTSDNVTIGGDLTVTGADMTLGGDSDGTDRSIVFGHTTLKSIMGIDDSADRFVINTDATFDGTIADNDFSIDASGNCYIKGDLTITGGRITFGNGEIVRNETNDFIEFTTPTVAIVGSTDADLRLYGTDDAKITFWEGSTQKWSFGYDDNDSYKLKIDYINNTSGSVGGGTKLEIDSSGNITTAADITFTTGDTVISKSAGDALVKWQLGGAVKAVGGIDDSDGDKFKIHYGTSLIANSHFEIDSGGTVSVNGDLMPNKLIYNKEANQTLADNNSITIGYGYKPVTSSGDVTGIRFASGGTNGQQIIVKNVGANKITFHNTEGTALVRGIHADHDTIPAGGLCLFISDGTYWNLIAGGVDTQPDVGLIAS